MSWRVCLAILALCAALPAGAAFRVTVTGVDRLEEARPSKVAVVTVECADALDCHAIERKVLLEARKLELGFEIVPENVVRDLLFDHGFTAYSPERRELLERELGVDALFELHVPFGVKGDGFAGRRSSEAKIELFVVEPQGGILLHGVGTGRPNNVVSSPERVAGNIVERIFDKIAR